MDVGSHAFDVVGVAVDRRFFYVFHINESSGIILSVSYFNI